MNTSYWYDFQIPDGAEKIQIPPRQTAFVCRRAKKGDVINFWVHSDGTFASGIYCTQNEKEEDLEKLVINFSTIISTAIVKLYRKIYTESVFVVYFNRT